MKHIQNVAGFCFIIAVAVLAIISICGVWEIFSSDVITKSFETLGLLAVVAVIVMVAGRYVDNRSQQGSEALIIAPHPIFKTLRQITLGILIASASVLALLGVLAIWDVIADKTVLYRSLGSLGILAFSSLIIVMTCKEREGSSAPSGAPGSAASGQFPYAGAIGILFVVFVIFMIFLR